MNNEKPIKAYRGESNTRIYEYPNGKVEKRIGGSRSWRNTNPGNIRHFDGNPWNGLIGTDPEFDIFDSYKNGYRAIGKIFISKSKRGLTLAQAIREYAPEEDGNDVKKYIEGVVNDTRIPANTLLSLVINVKLEAIKKAIVKHEGWFVGETVTSSGNKTPRKENSKKEGQYIWRTSGDDKVRHEHAVREGKVFSWDNPPEGGHPGEEYGCRCMAEPYPNETTPHLEKILGK